MRWVQLNLSFAKWSVIFWEILNNFLWFIAHENSYDNYYYCALRGKNNVHHFLSPVVSFVKGLITFLMMACVLSQRNLNKNVMKMVLDLFQISDIPLLFSQRMWRAVLQVFPVRKPHRVPRGSASYGHMFVRCQRTYIRYISNASGMKFVLKSRKIFSCWFFYVCFVVAPDGLKGKTWGPSTIHQRERGQIINKVQDSPKRWSKSAPNLEKSQKTNGQIVGGLQDIGEFCIPKQKSQASFRLHEYLMCTCVCVFPSLFLTCSRSFWRMSSM